MFLLYMSDDLEKKRAERLEKQEQLPVVARLVVEIRSDGRHTIARGAAEDASGERVQVEAQGTTPLQLAFSLVRSLAQVPAVARSFTRSLLPNRRK
ncbi:MAG TPA: hypothetical protein VEP66_21735 [Myxococcales bacterium]|nr:hypothetical protein [Myxococcales bacterium]